jgi:DNA polymerase-3 subunit epsilon
MRMVKMYADSETTGTDPKRHGLHQFSAKLEIDGTLVDEIDLRIKPFPDDVIEDKALEVGNVTREQLFSPMRMEPQQAHTKIVTMLGRHIDKFDRSNKAHFLAYKAAFDADFLREFFIKCGDTYFGSWFWTPPLCIMTLGGYLLQRERANLENFKLKTVWEYLNGGPGDYTEEQWHDSLFDIDRAREVESFLRERVVRGRKAPTVPLPPKPC